MSQQTETAYEFRADVPLEPVPAGTNLLVSGAVSQRTRGFLMRLLDGRSDEGMVFISTDRTGQEVVEAYEAWVGGYDPDRMAVVDCNEDSTVSERFNVCDVANPSDLTGMGMRFSSLYEALRGEGVERVRTGMSSLSPLLMYAKDFRIIYRFLHTITGRISTAGGLGVFALDPDTVDTTTFSSLSQPFDCEVALRRTDDADTYELKATGLADQPEGWHEFTLSRDG